MTFDDVYKHSAGTLRWLRSEEGKHFVEAMKDQLEELRIKIVRENDPTEVFRLQGSIKTLERFANMDSELVEMHRRRTSNDSAMAAAVSVMSKD